MSKLGWSLAGLIVAGCAGLDAATPRKISASPTPMVPTVRSDAIAPADAQIVAELATGSVAGTASVHPLIVRRNIRFTDLIAGDDDRWYTPWFDLKEGAATASLYPIRVVVKCTINNIQDYLIGKPGSKTCVAGIEVTDHTPTASSSAGFWPVASGSFDAFKEAYYGTIVNYYPYTRYQLAATGSVYAIRHGKYGPDALYAKMVVDNVDISLALKFADVSWAFQTHPGVRSLDSSVDPATYVRDPSPSPTPKE